MSGWLSERAVRTVLTPVLEKYDFDCGADACVRVLPPSRSVDDAAS